MLPSEWWWLVTGAALGASLVVGAALLLLVWLARPPPPPHPEKPEPLRCTVPQAILNELTRGAGSTAEGALNAALQFIFQQSTADTRWLRRRMAAELAELLAKAPSGRLFESLTLRSLDVGTEFPSISNLRLVSGELEEGARLRSLDLTLDLAYDGSFRIDVDAVMLLGKIANISITGEPLGTEFPSASNLRLVSGKLEEGARLRSLDLTLDLAYDGSFRIDVDAVMLLGKIANISITGEPLGTEFPSASNLRLVSGKLEEGARLRSLDLTLDLAYDGSFRIDVDAVMLLGKIANISITGELLGTEFPSISNLRLVSGELEEGARLLSLNLTLDLANDGSFRIDVEAVMLLGKIANISISGEPFGTEFPSVSNLRLVSGELEESERLRSLDLTLDLVYDGSFRIDVDAIMLLGKIANISITGEPLDTEFPSVSNLRLVSGELEEGARLRSLDLTLDLAYDGFFRIDVDAFMLLGKIANILIITVESVGGPVRLLFRRAPYTHWALAFETPPRLELRVRGRFQGRQLKPRLASLVAAHIRRAVAQRHTLPNYKIRYKPFFPKSEPGSAESEEGPLPGGCLTVHLMEVTRLQCPSASSTPPVQVRAVLAVDSHAWVSLRRDVLTLDITVVPPVGGGQLGLVCCQSLGAQVAVDTVVPMSPAYRADLRRGDIVLAIDSKPASTVGQVGKLLRNAEMRAVTLRVRRVMPRRGHTGPERGGLEPGSGPELKRTKTNSFSFRRVSEVMEGVRLQGMKVAQGKTSVQEPESMIQKFVDAQVQVDAKKSPESTKSVQKPQEPVAPVIGPGGSFGLRKRRCSVENKHSSDSSAGSTPPASGASTPLRTTKDAGRQPTKYTEIPTIIRTDSGEIPKYYDKLDPKAYESIVASDESSPPDESVTSESSGHSRHSDHIEICQMHSTKTVPLKPIVTFDERAEFKLNENHKYLNVNMWATTLPGENDETLLGYLNIPLASLLLECQDSTIGHHMKRYQFLPPDVDIKFSKCHPLSSHAGFEPCLCFGDALVWWSWETGGGGGGPPRATPPQPAPPPPRAPSAARAQHDFVRTHFHRSTQCDFCSKKIWLKDAMQCRSCGLCCHKKCVAKCQESSPCAPREPSEGGGGDASAGSGGGRSPPELVTTEAECGGDDSDDEPRRKDSLDVQDEGVSGMGALVAGLRRAGSAQALSAPRASANQARSLPPSPSHTPRKQSLEASGAAPNPFSGCGAAWRARGSVGSLVEPALRSSLSPDALLAAARDSAPELAALMSLDQIHTMLVATRDALATHVDEGRLGSESGKSHALTALMLHCCAAAQLAQERERTAATATASADTAANAAPNATTNGGTTTATAEPGGK